ncbi:MAG: DsbA family oxidoreductase [Actinobacteria bacterium]|nr:DsbA family oxidoreductase [Actinomycetota bacterium]
MVAAVQVEIVSDVVCPWCYIGKRRFEKALDDLRHTLPSLEVRVRYRAYQLDPSAPIDAPSPVIDSYAKRFGGPERAAEIIARVSEVAATEGIEFRMAQALRTNTRRAHRLLKFVEVHAEHLQSSVNERLMQAYFHDGLDIGDPAVLAQGARDAGFQHPLLDTVLSTDADEWSQRVVDDLAWAADRDITAVPTFVIDDAMVIPGAQDTSMFVRILRKLADK